MKQSIARALAALLIFLAFTAAEPIAVRPVQSPPATPPAFTSPLASPSPISPDAPASPEAAPLPLIWIAGGLILGGAIALIARRASTRVE